MKSISKSHTANTFCVTNTFLPRKAVCLEVGAQADTCVPSMAPMQSYIYNDFNMILTSLEKYKEIKLLIKLLLG